MISEEDLKKSLLLLKTSMDSIDKELLVEGSMHLCMSNIMDVIIAIDLYYTEALDQRNSSDYVGILSVMAGSPATFNLSKEGYKIILTPKYCKLIRPDKDRVYLA